MVSVALYSVSEKYSLVLIIKILLRSNQWKDFIIKLKILKNNR